MGEVLKVDKQIFKGFDQNIQDKGESFIKEMGKAEKEDKKGEIKEKAESFILNSGIVLKLILGDMSDGTKFSTIDASNIKEPKLQTYVDAKKAFEEDMKSLNVVNSEVTKLLGDIQNCIDLKEIEKDSKFADKFDKTKIMTLIALTTVPETKKTLSDKLTYLKSKETDMLNSLLNAAPSREIANSLFEKNQVARNALLAKNRKQTDTNKTQEQKNFEKLLKFYGGDKQEVENYEVKNYDKENNPKYNYIQVKFKEIPAVKADEATKQKAVEAVKERTKDIMFGSSPDIVHTARSEVYEGVWNDSIDIKANIKTLDNNGSYREFEDIIKKQIDPANFLSGLLGKGLLEEINKYETTDDKEIKTNGYYGVILDYITETKNELLLNTYLNNVIVGDAINLKYLGTNPKSQIENFNKIVDKNTGTINKTSDNGKLLERIRLQLANVDKKTFQESLSKGLDALIEQFGPMLFSVLKMFGMGKGSLLKMFGKGYEKKINEMYKKEYELSGEQIENINKIVESESENDKSKPIFSKEGEEKRLETGADIEKAFQEKKKDYINLMRNKDKGYYKNINVNVLQKGLNAYNKEKNKELNINDIVVIKTDSTTKKQSISEIREDFEGVMENILEDNSTRETIAGSNQEIRTEKEDKNGVKSKLNEQGLEAKGKEAYKYIIQSEQDIARYLTASLFSDKDLGYVMTENKLHNDKEMPTDQDESEEQAKDIFGNKANKLNTELDKVDDNGMYGKLDTNTFTGKENMTDLVDYKNKILVPLKNLFIGKTIVGGKEYLNYNFLLNQMGDRMETKKNEDGMIGIKNMLINESKTEYKATIDAIQKGNTYEVSVVNNKIIYKTKNSLGKETGTITLGVVNNTITTERKPEEAKATATESKTEVATPQKNPAETTPAEEKKGATAETKPETT